MGSWQMTAQHFLFAQCVLSIYLSHPWKQSTPAGAQVKVTETVVEKRALLTISVLPQKLLSEILDASYGSGQNGEIGKHYLLAEGAAVSLSACSHPTSLAQHVHRKGFVDRLWNVFMEFTLSFLFILHLQEAGKESKNQTYCAKCFQY